MEQKIFVSYETLVAFMTSGQGITPQHSIPAQTRAQDLLEQSSSKPISFSMAERRAATPESA